MKRIIYFKLAPKKTCWWSNDWRPKSKLHTREDKFFSISRLYHRTMKYYSYEIIIGRFAIHILPNKETK